MEKRRFSGFWHFCRPWPSRSTRESTGPTHPIRGRESVGRSELSYRFLRSHTAHQPLPVAVTCGSEARPCAGSSIAMRLLYRRFNTGENWTTLPMVGTPDQRNLSVRTFAAVIPGQPAAGKVEYHDPRPRRRGAGDNAAPWQVDRRPFQGRECRRRSCCYTSDSCSWEYGSPSARGWRR